MKYILFHLFYFYIKSSIHVALSVVSLSLITLRLYGESVSVELLIFIFSSAVFAYNFIKFYPQILKPFKTSVPRSIKTLSVSCGCVGFGLFWRLPFFAQGFALVGALLVVFYAIPFYGRDTNWRNKEGGKIYWVVLSWLCLTVGVPLASAIDFDTVTFLKISFVQGIFILVSIFPFEIRDLLFDDKILKTIPQRYGIKKTKRLGFALLTIGLLFVFVFTDYNGSWYLSTSMSYCILGFLLEKTTVQKSFYYSAFWIEGIPVFWWLSLSLIS